MAQEHEDRRGISQTKLEKVTNARGDYISAAAHAVGIVGLGLVDVRCTDQAWDGSAKKYLDIYSWEITGSEKSLETFQVLLQEADNFAAAVTVSQPPAAHMLIRFRIIEAAQQIK